MTMDNMAVEIGSDEASNSGAIVSQLNTFLRGEISAVETYKQALDRAQNNPADAPSPTFFRQIQEEHGRAAQSIRDRIRELGGEASDSSGVWGTWAKTVHATMMTFGGENGCLKALKEGEEHGLKDYDANVTKLDSTSRQLIEGQLIPAQERHIELLDRLIAAPKV